MTEDKQFLSIPEAAEIIGVSRIAVFKKVKKGQLPGIRIGRNWAIPAGAVSKPEPRPPASPAAPAEGPRREPEPTPTPQPPSMPADTGPETDPLDEMGWD